MGDTIASQVMAMACEAAGEDVSGRYGPTVADAIDALADARAGRDVDASGMSIAEALGALRGSGGAGSFAVVLDLSGGKLAAFDDDLGALETLAEGVAYSKRAGDGSTFSLGTPSPPSEGWRFAGWLAEGMDPGMADGSIRVKGGGAEAEGWSWPPEGYPGDRASTVVKSGGARSAVEFGDVGAPGGAVLLTALWIAFDAPSGRIVYDGAAHPATASMMPEALGAATVTYSRDGGAKWVKTVPKDAGAYKAKYVFADKEHGSGATFEGVSGDLEIVKAPVTVRLEMMRDGERFETLGLKPEGLPDGFDASIASGEEVPYAVVKVEGLVGEDEIPSNPLAAKSPVKYRLGSSNSPSSGAYTRQYQWYVMLNSDSDNYDVYGPGGGPVSKLQTIDSFSLAQERRSLGDAVIAESSPIAEDSLLHDHARGADLMRSDHTTLFYHASKAAAPAPEGAVRHGGDFYVAGAVVGSGLNYPTSPGVYMAKLEGYGEYSGVRWVAFEVEEAESIAEGGRVGARLDPEASESSVFDGRDHAPRAVLEALEGNGVYEAGSALAEGQDFRVRTYYSASLDEGASVGDAAPHYGRSVAPGTYWVVARGGGAFSGSVALRYRIEPCPLEVDGGPNLQLRMSMPDVWMKAGKPLENLRPTVRLYDRDGQTLLYELTEGADYDVLYKCGSTSSSDLTKLGKMDTGTEIECVVSAHAGAAAPTFEGSTSFRFAARETPSISAMEFSFEDGWMAGDRPSVEWTGFPIEPKLQVKDGDKVLVEGEGGDYTVRYRDNVDVGIGSVTVSGTGKVGGYYGSTRLRFEIVAPAG